MSAFVVSKEHIDAMLSCRTHSTFGISWMHEGEYHRLEEGADTLDRVGRMLWAENVASVEHRYSPPGREAIYGEGFESGPDFNLPGKYTVEQIPGSEDTIELPEWLTEYSYSRTRLPSPVEGLSITACFEYQSCEHEGWESSEARAFCEALRSACIYALPGYADAAWEWRS